MKRQVIFVHGGTVWKNTEDFYSYLKQKEVDRIETTDYWSYWLKEQLEDTEFFMPQMPNKRNADYTSWCIWFEKYFEFIQEDTEFILVGHSLGASFLSRYLSEHTLPRKADQLHLVSLPLFEDDLDGEILGSFVTNTDKLPHVHTQAKNIFVYHSEDDPVVAISDSEYFVEHVSESVFIRFQDRGHIHQETFPELLENIKKYL
jgi:predicted alpha/beta hydrolase family esterase